MRARATSSAACAAGRTFSATSRSGFEPDQEVVRIEPHRGWVALNLRELWQYRELVEFLALRDIKIRYKQSLLGIGWAILQPLLTMLVFDLLFGVLLGRNSKPTLPGIPYAVSTYCALVPWQLFARSLGQSGNSLVANRSLITKVYFPRLVAPISPIFAALVDFAFVFAVLVVMMVFYRVSPGWEVVTLPLFILLAMATALAASLWLAAINAIYRDVGYALPFLVQIWMFVTPVLYTTERLLSSQPDWVRWLYGLNPMAGVVEGFRWALLGAASPPWGVVASSILMVTAGLVGGLFFFRRLERTFADLV